ncbi:hypothetical protein V8C37DRAFT_418214 [Trichoderma ceciliae]
MECQVNEPNDTVAEVLAPGYPIVEHVQEGEGDKPFACPHFSCDGFTFDTIQECRIHEEDWHNPPYFCSECEASFAARPALKRHFKSSGHFNWICLEENCSMKSTLFANQGEFVNHALNTPGHEHLFLHETIYSPATEKRINYAEVIHLWGEESTLGGSSEEEEYLCPEPACRRYQQAFYSESEFNRHKESHGHVQAIGYSESLRNSGKSVADITTEQEAAREFRCTAERCRYFGEKLKTSQSFYKHINTTQHLNPPNDSASNPASPTAEIRLKFSQLNISCDEPECPKCEHRFSSLRNYTKHVQSAVHLASVKYGQMKRSVANTDPEGQHDIVTQTPERRKPAVMAAPPSTPPYWSPFAFSPISPTAADGTRVVDRPKVVTPTKRLVQDISLMTPPSSWREENLKKRNRELESELQQMKDKIERMRAAYKEQISSLFQTLASKQDGDLL